MVSRITEEIVRRHYTEGSTIDLRSPQRSNAWLSAIQSLHKEGRKVQRLYLQGSGYNNSGLQSLAGIPLTVLYLGCRHISDKGLSHLTGMPLEKLFLGETKVRGAGLVHLRGAPLKKLMVWGPAHTDQLFEFLPAFPLEALDIFGGKVTKERLEQFSQDHPTCRVGGSLRLSYAQDTITETGSPQAPAEET